MPRLEASRTKPGFGLVDEEDHRAGGLLDDLLDQDERVLGALAETHQCDVRPLPGRHGPDLVDIDLARDHLVSERGDYRRNEGEPIAPFVGDQHAEMVCLASAHSPRGPRV